MNKSLSFAMFLVVFVILGGNLKAQSCNFVMACNDRVNVSLDTNCTETIRPDMVLQSPLLPNSEFTVKVTTKNGTLIPGGVMNSSHLGQVFSVTVTHNTCNLSCWGTILIEDKLAPVITSCEDVTIECRDSKLPSPLVPAPTASDACTSVSSVYYDAVVQLPCTSPFVSAITRTWVVSDSFNNSATCIQTISVRRATIDDVSFPRNYDDIDLPALRCTTNIPLLPNGAPSPTFTGFPTGVDCSNIQTYYTDIVFNLCGAGIKVLRQWNVIDWCTGRDTTGNQTIKVIDDINPVCTAPPDTLIISTDSGKCSGTFSVPPPIVVSECSAWTYIVGYKLRDPSGNPFVDPIYDNVTGNSITGYTITNLPVDTTWIVYTIIDDCGNSTQCFTEVVVVDREAPTAICEGYTVVSLEDTGIAKLFAINVDDHSKDNCGIDRFEIRRLTDACGIPENLQFGEYVKFCCEDSNSDPNYYVKVVMRVYDTSGNFNDCVANVKVQDKYRPEILCPYNITIDCEQDPDDLTLTGVATASDNCSTRVTYSDTKNLNDCGLGTIRRTWRAEDPSGQFRQCTQSITVVKNNPFTASNIVWPGKRTIQGCTTADAHPDLIGNRPILSNTACTQLGVSYRDQVFYGFEGVCVKILRTWRVIDWCTADPNNPVFFTHVQEILLEDNNPPTFISGCNNRTVTSLEGDCEEYVEHSVVAHDICTPADLLRYRWSYDRDNNGTVDDQGNGSFVGRIYPAGTHRMTFTVEDNCGNTASCSYTFTVRDLKPPTPICYGEVVWTLDQDGTAEIWASDFNHKSEAGCGTNNQLRFSFNAEGTQPGRVFTCADIPNGVSARIPLRMYVIDQSGNFDFCEVTLFLQDSQNTNACPDAPGAGARVAGRILNEMNEGIQDANVVIENVVSNEVLKIMSDTEGEYEFEKVAFYGDYTVSSLKNDDIQNGISTLDMVLIQRHILGLQKLDSPLKFIAADVNNSKNITTADLIALRKVVLGIEQSFPNNSSWRFIPAEYEFADPEYPFEFNQQWWIEQLMTDKEGLDFVAVKVGDVNSSATVNMNNNDIESRNSNMVLTAENANVAPSTEIPVSVYSGMQVSLYGLQFDLEFDPLLLEFQGISSSIFKIDESNYYLNRAGKLAVSIDKFDGVNVPAGEALFTLKFKGLQSGDLSSLRFTSEILNAEAYTNLNEIRKLTLEVRGLSSDITESASLMQNTPNPFNTVTTIAFTMQNEGEASLRIFDSTGKEVWSKESFFGKGLNQISVDAVKSRLRAGIYYYQLETSNYVQSKKMIVID